MSNISKIELEVENYIKSLKIKYERNNRSILKSFFDGWTNMEVDFWFPELKFGIEVDGDYYHNMPGNQDYKFIYVCSWFPFFNRLSRHQDNNERTIVKLATILKNNVFVYHIYEFEWNDITLRNKVIDDLNKIIEGKYNNYNLEKKRIVIDAGKDDYTFLLKNGYIITYYRKPEIIHKTNKINVHDCGKFIMKKDDDEF